MAKILTENDIEKASIEVLENNGYKHINAYITLDKVKSRDNILEIEEDGTGRSNIREVILPDVLLSSLKRINPQVPLEILENIVSGLRTFYSPKDLKSTNYDNYKILKEGIKVEYEEDGEKKFETVRVIDFNNIEINDFTVVSQMWIRGEINYRRPDLLLFVNGLPLVFIELKNSDVKLKTAYTDNLKNYLKDIPQLFFFNQITVLSNAIETRLGSFTAGYEHFFEWLRSSEEEKVDRKEIKEKGISIEYLLNGLLKKGELLDYVENFILYENERTKIIAKNHQYLGVNNSIEQFKNRDKLEGKLGVFWHTQGSGKSYSMAFFVNKINRKIPGNFTFLMVTDRRDLDDQLYKNFLRTEVVTEEESAQPKDSKELREFLKTSKAFIFTLIHKFRYDKTKEYPILSERDDIIVIVDEAHRTQYKDLAENMRTGLPNAGYIAFTGTPLLGSKRLTNQWFGDYVSEYNFSQSIEDGATVDLFYSRRVPEVALTNTELEDDYLEIIESENLTPEQEEKLKRNYSKTNEVIKRDDRIDIVAKDIVKHFPNRGYKGKAMVVSVDKFTAVKMYDKVQYHWDEKIKKLMKERSSTNDELKKIELKKKIDYMDSIEMAVVLSEDNNEEERFKKEGLDIRKHRDRINLIDENGQDIEDNFKDPNHPLSIVFICAMWLTGFDAPATSTLYLDKPMKGHTLMQAIARVNRVFPGKHSGLVVDYLNLFKSMEAALGDYGNPEDMEDMPVKDISALLHLLDMTIRETVEFAYPLGIDFLEIFSTRDTFKRVELLEEALDAIFDKDEQREEFKIYANLCRNTYEASKPEVFEMGWANNYLSPILYLDDMIRAHVGDENIESAKQRLQRVLDRSVMAKPASESESGYEIRQMKSINLSDLTPSEIKKKIDEAPYKNLAIAEVRVFIEQKLEQLLKKNQSRISFSEKYKEIINKYNSGNTTNENYYEELVEFMEELNKEEDRHIREGLTEEELELYDLFKKDNLTLKEEEQVKLSAKELYKSITSKSSVTQKVDWYKDEQLKQRLKSEVDEVLDSYLPKSYDRDIFKLKADAVFLHIIQQAMNRALLKTG